MKKQKHPRLGNGLGSIRYLGAGRSCPYGVYPPEYRLTDAGYLSYKKALCYVPDWYTGFAVLISYRAGTYHPGDEIEIAKKSAVSSPAQLSELAQKIMADFRMIQNGETAAPLFSEVWDQYDEYRFGIHATKKYSKSLRLAFENAGRFVAPLMKRRIDRISLMDLQDLVNRLSEQYSASYVKLIIAQISSVYSFAAKYGYIERDISKQLEVPLIARPEQAGEAFSRSELRVVWRKANEGDRLAQSILVHCYSGFRLAAFYDGMVIDMKAQTFFGGVKTGRRLVPILEEIRPFVHDPVYEVSAQYASKRIREWCAANGLSVHTSHDCRHTFKSLMDRAGVSPVAQRLLMGHSSGQDVHDRVYTHFDVEDLRREIEKITVIK